MAAVAVHLAVFVAIINFSFNFEPPQLMMPAPQVIKATLVMASKPAVQARPVQDEVPLKKAKPVSFLKQKLRQKQKQKQKQKPVIKKSAMVNPKTEPKLAPIPLPAPQLEVEPFQAAEETQQARDAVDVLVEQAQLHKASIDKASYVPASSNVAYFHNPTPRYPSAAKRRGMQGLVELRVTVNSHGQPVSVEVKQSSGFQLLDREAIKAIRQWRFQPAQRAGIAVAGEVLVPVHYRLNSV